MAARLQFGIYEVDLGSRELRRAGARIAIQPQPLTVLVLLASRPGEVVSRRELRDALWGDHTHVDFERSLNFCVAQLRRTLRDSATSPRFIETLPRQGYRFLAPVHRSKPGSPPPGSARRWRLRTLPIGIFVVVAWLGWGERQTDPGSSPATAVAPTPSAAYVRGLYHAGRGPAEWPAAIGWLERAVEDAPGDDAARVALARTYYRAAEAQVRTGRDVFPRARLVAATAVEREPENAEARLWYALARIYGDWDWGGGGEQLRRAVALAPRSVAAQRALAAYFGALGDHAGALSAIESARRLDPVCLTLTGEHALYLYRARRFAEAAAAWRGILEVHEDAAPHEGLFQLYRVGGRESTAAGEALRVMTLVGVPAATVEGLSRRAPDEVVRGFLRGALDQLGRPGTGTGPERLALFRAALGEPDQALSLLEAACHDHSPGLPQTLQDPAFDALRGGARFKGVIECVGLGQSGLSATRSAGVVTRPAAPAS